MFRSRAKNGKAVIGGAIAVFENASKELQRGIELCDAEECELEAKINRLKEKKASVALSRVQAQAVDRNINQMLKQ